MKDSSIATSAAWENRRGMILAILGSAFLSGFAVTASSSDHQPLQQTRYATVAIHPQQDHPETGEIQYSNSTADGILLRGATIESLLMSAFGVLPDQIIGIPHSMSEERYDVTARVDPEDVSAYQEMTAVDKRVMLQALLIDRFGLAYHHELKPRRVYELVPAKTGIKLKAPSSDHFTLSVGRGRLEAKDAPLSALIEVLVPQVGRIVLDKSGLHGKYDYALSWDPDDDQPRDIPPGSPLRGREIDDQRADKGSLFRALVEQLGLRLEGRTDAIDAIVVDHISQPSGN